VKPHIVGFIFARGGSKGAPRKNIRLLAGKPLIAHAIETARASKFIDRVVVSTDDTEIAEVARQFGAEVPFIRPAELAQDNSPEWAAWQHAIRALQAVPNARTIDVFVSIPPTSPLRAPGDVDRCIEKVLETDADIVITVKPADRSPWFNMVVLNREDNAELVIKPEGAIHHRQSAPEVFDITTVAYAARPEFILRANSLFEGKVKMVLVPAERSLDIDTEFDFKLAEILFSQ
jgi:N-acylneuraminate cytidylyltransferase